MAKLLPFLRRPKPVTTERRGTQLTIRLNLDAILKRVRDRRTKTP